MSCYDYSEDDIEFSSSPDGQLSSGNNESVGQDTKDQVANIDSSSITPTGLHEYITGPVYEIILNDEVWTETIKSDDSTKTSNDGTKTPKAFNQALALSTIAASFNKPLARRLMNRPPPSTPPEFIMQAGLSTPTLPVLNQNSLPALIEQYRIERAVEPHEFDRKTQEIKEQQAQAKIERGGTCVLLRSEYSAELASRLDAEMVEKMAEIRNRDCVESDTEECIDDELAMRYEHLKPVTNSQSSAEHIDLAQDKADKNIPTGCAPTSTDVPSSSKKPSTSGSIRYQTIHDNHTTSEGTRTETITTWIELTKQVKTINKENPPTKDPETISGSVTALSQPLTKQEPSNKDEKSIEQKIQEILTSLKNLHGTDSTSSSLAENHSNGHKIDHEVLELAEEMCDKLEQLRIRKNY